MIPFPGKSEINSWLMTYYLENEKKAAFVNILLDFWSIVVTVASFVSHSQINNNKSKCAKILYFHRPVVRTNCPLNDTRKWIQRAEGLLMDFFIYGRNCCQFFLADFPTWGGNLGPILHPGGECFGSWFFII